MKPKQSTNKNATRDMPLLKLKKKLKKMMNKHQMKLLMIKMKMSKTKTKRSNPDIKRKENPKVANTK
jgi:hypothetical protein